jgi:intracellular multiplication protein IcmS
MNEAQQSLIKVAKRLNAKFTLNGRNLVYEEVFSEAGLLPAIAKRADQLCALCLNYGIGVSFEEEENSMLKTKVSFDDTTPSIIRMMCLVDVLCELIYLAPSRDVTPLDELLYD